MSDQPSASRSGEAFALLYDHFHANMSKEEFEQMLRDLAAPVSEQLASEPVAWLYRLGKPGKRLTFASVDPNDTTEWPKDQWTNGYEVTPLFERNER